MYLVRAIPQGMPVAKAPTGKQDTHQSSKEAKRVQETLDRTKDVKMSWLSRSIIKLCLPFLCLSLVTLVAADVVTPLHDAGMIYNGKTSGIRYLSFLGNTDNKLISTSFTSLGRCPSRYQLGKPCVTFKLAKDGQLDDMDHHPG